MANEAFGAEYVWDGAIVYFKVSNEVASCADIPAGADGIYEINLPKNGSVTQPTKVYCDMTTEGGGWTVLLRRESGTEDFKKEWDDYKVGFGSLTGEFWAGNEIIHKLTSARRTFTLRVDLESYEGSRIYAKYNNFSVGPESDNYRLHVTGYLRSSTAGDSLSAHSDMMFSTQDRDNDELPENCASSAEAGWWFKKCRQVLLTGRYGRYPEVDRLKGIVWKVPWNVTTFAKRAVMMIRPIV